MGLTASYMLLPRFGSALGDSYSLFVLFSSFSFCTYPPGIQWKAVTPIRDSASKATKRLKLLSFLQFWHAFLQIMWFDCSFPFFPIPQLPCSPCKSSQSEPSVHHLPWMHTPPQLGFLPTCPRDHKGAPHCGPTSACTLIKKESDAGASRGFEEPGALRPCKFWTLCVPELPPHLCRDLQLRCPAELERTTASPNVLEVWTKL